MINLEKTNEKSNKVLSLEDANYLYRHGMRDIVLKYYDESELNTDYITDEEYLLIYKNCEYERHPVNKIAMFALHINTQRLMKSPIYKDNHDDSDYYHQSGNMDIAREDYVKKHNCKLYVVCNVENNPWEVKYYVAEIEVNIDFAKYDITGVFLNKEDAEYIANKLSIFRDTDE